MHRRPNHLAAWFTLLVALGIVVVAALVFSYGAKSGQPTAIAPATATYSLAIETGRAATNSGLRSPTPMLALGMLGPCAPGKVTGPQCTDVWRGIVNGEVIQVMGGQEGVDGDQTQGLAIVMNLSEHNEEVYSTTQKAGPVRIAAVNGTRVTFVPLNFATPWAILTPWTAATPSTTYVLDLVTRQWISPPPSFTPVPTPTWGSGAVPCFGSDWGKGWFIDDTSCWEGVINGYLVEVITGREVGKDGSNGPDAGFLSVYVYDPKDRTELNYERQDALPSPLRITSVRGTLVYLDGQDPYDIAGWLPVDTPTPSR